MLVAVTLSVARGESVLPVSAACDSSNWFATTSLSAAMATSRVLIITKSVPEIVPKVCLKSPSCKRGGNGVFRRPVRGYGRHGSEAGLLRSR